MGGARRGRRGRRRRPAKSARSAQNVRVAPGPPVPSSRPARDSRARLGARRGGGGGLGGAGRAGACSRREMRRVSNKPRAHRARARKRLPPKRQRIDRIMSSGEGAAVAGGAAPVSTRLERNGSEGRVRSCRTRRPRRRRALRPAQDAGGPTAAARGRRGRSPGGARAPQACLSRHPRAPPSSLLTAPSPCCRPCRTRRARG